jgi:pyrroloquinoline quinone (PQQ) biosynthesis protein C
MLPARKKKVSHHGLSHPKGLGHKGSVHKGSGQNGSPHSKNLGNSKIVRIERAWGKYLDPKLLAELDETSFMQQCKGGVATKEMLHTYVRQQFHYSRHFTRYLSALLANVVDEGDRRELVDNLFEEMGLGEFGAKPHSLIYRDMMKSMGVRAEDEPVFEATQHLVETMLELCKGKNHLVGLGALCVAAEAIVPHMYSTIVRGFRAAGTPESDLEFYMIHIEGDDEHAKTMRKIMDREIARNPDALHDIHHGARLGIKARIRFFEEIARHHGDLSHKKARLRVV